MGEQLFRGYKYLIEESEVFVRNRPRATYLGQKDFEVEEPADAYLSVTDTFVIPPPDKIFVWMPWNECRKPSHELWYAVNLTLWWWIYKQKVKKVQIFCDAGTHRSVTVFGAFLHTYFDKKEAQKIVDSRISVNVRDCQYGDPLDYMIKYLEEFPEDRLLFKSMRKYPLFRLDDHTRIIFEYVKKRFEDNNGL